MPKAKEACGLFGVHGHEDAVAITYCGLFSLQHRGQESAGLAALSKGSIEGLRGMGRLQDVFGPQELEALRGPAALGHVRYSTTGESLACNAQPLIVRYHQGQVALGHNGNLVNRHQLRKRLEDEGSIFATTTDSEVVLHLLARCGQKRSRLEALKSTLAQLRGAFSLLMLWPDALIGIRDPWGFRPLWYGTKDGAHIFASETAALDIVGAEAVREVEPGTMLIAGENGVESIRFAEPARSAHCLFEHVYFARPDSHIFGDLVQDVRMRAGRALAREAPVEADLVCPIPDSGNESALGYSLESGIPYGFCFVRNHYVGRTFINPSANDRLVATDLKLNLIRSAVVGKRIVIVDDSIVRGTTARRRVKMLREAGAKEIHFRVSCPPTRHPCHYGIDFKSKGELIAATKDLAGIRRHLDLDSLAYISMEGLLGCVSKKPEDYCTACWTGDYPIAAAEIDEDFEVEV